MALIDVDVRGVLPMKKQLELLKLGPAKRRKLLYRVGQRVMRDARKRIRMQTDLAGAAFKPGHKPEVDSHRHKRGKRMLKGLGKLMRVMKNDGISAEIGLPGFAGVIAAKQQFGSQETVTAAQAKAGLSSAKAQAKKNEPATRRQAKALKDLGYKPVGKRPVSLGWITNNLTIGQARAILRSMRQKAGHSTKSSWTTRLPARSFLGATDAEVVEHVNLVFETMLGEFNRGIG